MPKGKLLGWLLLVIALGLVVLFARPVYRHGKNWRARQLASESEEELLKNAETQALTKAEAAYRLGPTEPAAIRAVARVLTRKSDPAALRFWQAATQSPGVTSDDRRAYIDASLAQGLVSQAVEQEEILLRSDGADARNVLLSAKLKALRGDPVNALAFARRAREMDPANDEAAFFLASLLLGETDSRATGRDILWSLGEKKSQRGLDALALLARQKELTSQEQERLILKLKDHPLSTDSHRLVAMEVELQRRPERRAELLAGAVIAHRGAAPEVLRNFGVWLNARREPARTIEAIPQDKALARKDLFLVHLDALAALERWSDLATLLEARDAPLEESLREVFRARCSLELGDSSSAELHWSRARLASAKDPQQGWYVASYAEKLGQLKHAEPIYRKLLEQQQTARMAGEGLLRIATTKGTVATRDLLREIRLRWPEDRAIANDYAYLNLLLGDEVEASHKQAEQLVSKSPASLPHRTALALGHLRLNENAAALQVYGGLAIPWDKAPAATVAVYAAVLNANSESETARRMAASIRLETLRPEERKLIEFSR